MLDHPDLVNTLEAVFLMTLVEAVLEHQMNVKIATKCCLVLQMKSKSQLLIRDTQEVSLFKIKHRSKLTFSFRQKNQEL